MQKKNQDLEKYLINLDKILNDKETRTSIIIKEIPVSFGPKNFYELLSIFSNEIKFFFYS